MKPKRFALIVAGGSGTRMGTETPKQFTQLQGLPILMHTLKVFNKLDTQASIHLVLPSHEISRWHELCKKYSLTIPHIIIAGGQTRFHSVKNGLDAIEANGLIAIHDGVRPFVTPKLIEECFRVAHEKGNAVPAIKPNESIRYGTNDKNRKEDRNLLWLIQTPQVFELKKIKSYYQTQWKEEYTDDASVAEAFGEHINLVEGDRQNIKITTPIDLIMANAIAESIWKTENYPE